MHGAGVGPMFPPVLREWVFFLPETKVKENFPKEYAARERDKLRYRYPRGESYLDIIARLEPVIFEMERQKAPLLIIAHQVRCLRRGRVPAGEGFGCGQA